MAVEHPNTLAGLIDKRREIAGKIEHHQRVLNELIVDLDHVDHTIRPFRPGLRRGAGAAEAIPATPSGIPGRDAAVRSGCPQSRQRAHYVTGGRHRGGEGPWARPQRPARREPHTQARGGVPVLAQGQGIAPDVPTARQYKGWELVA